MNFDTPSFRTECIHGKRVHHGYKTTRTAHFKLTDVDNYKTTKKKFSWDLLLKIIIAVASAVAGALGVSACR